MAGVGVDREQAVPARGSRSRPAVYRRLNFVCSIHVEPVMETILTHLGVEPRLPPKGRALESVPHVTA
jgi:hypothetical protein